MTKTGQETYLKLWFSVPEVAELSLRNGLTL